MAGKVNIIGSGPSGKVQYREGFLKKNSCEFYWEFGGGDVVATIWVPAEEQWDAKIPWARGRRQEILESVAEQVRRRQAPSSQIRWEPDRFHLVKK